MLKISAWEVQCNKESLIFGFLLCACVRVHTHAFVRTYVRTYMYMLEFWWWYSLSRVLLFMS